jgi:hypothetical protein
MVKEFCELIVDDNGISVFQSDGQYEWPYKWDKDIITYCVLEGAKDTNAKSKLRKMVGIALTTWGIEIPTKFHRVKKDQNPDIKIVFENDPTADKLFIDNPRALAYAGYPKTSKQGVVVFNDYKYEWGAKDRWVEGKHVYNAVHVLIHELGHTLGLSHDSTNAGADVMDPYYNGKTNLSEFDIERIRSKYGVRQYNRWSLYDRLRRAINHRSANIR